MALGHLPDLFPLRRPELNRTVQVLLMPFSRSSRSYLFCRTGRIRRSVFAHARFRPPRAASVTPAVVATRKLGHTFRG